MSEDLEETPMDPFDDEFPEESLDDNNTKPELPERPKQRITPVTTKSEPRYSEVSLRT